MNLPFFIWPRCILYPAWLMGSITSRSLFWLIIGLSVITKTCISWIFDVSQVHWNPLLCTALAAVVTGLIMIRRMHSACTFGGAAKLRVLREQCARCLLFPEMFNILCLFYSTTSTGAVLLWVSILLLGQMKTSWSSVTRLSLRSLNQPTVFCSAWGMALVLFCSSSSSSSSSVLATLLITSQDVA